MLDYARPRSWRTGTPVDPAHAPLHNRAPRCLRDNECRSRRAGRHLSRKSPPAGTTAIALTRILTGGGWWALGRGSRLAGVATDVIPRLCGSHNPGWSRLPHGRLPLRQELHKLWTAAGSLLVRTNCKSEPENEVGRRVGIGVAEVEANQPGAVRVGFAARGSRFAIALTGASCPDSGATAGRPERQPTRGPVALLLLPRRRLLA